jgi:hypothetical protein
MSIHDGVVTVAESEIPVIIELDDDRIRLSASGSEIGDWGTEECKITHVRDATYTIEAEEETLRFVPNQPGVFAAAFNGGIEVVPTPLATDPEDDPAPIEMGEAPPAKPMTMGLFYALCVLTAALAVWSVISIVF